MNLEVLNLAYNQLSTSSVQSLQTMPKLRILDLTANGLNEIPHDFGNFSTLEELNLSDNLFTS
jgi:Leucine-rich repeat (LRR) protein